MAKSKKLSNPTSTGAAGAHFENHVQSSFVVLMLTGGCAPCLPTGDIEEIKLQGKNRGINTDDIIVYVKEPRDGEEHKCLFQIKRTIKFSQADTTFAAVIQTAWDDFISSSFTKENDRIALIVAQLAAKEIEEVRDLLDWARYRSSEEFIDDVAKENYSNDTKRNMLQAFRVQLQNANNGTALDEKTLWEFLRHYYVLGYDLGRETGVVLSLLHSHIAQFQKENPQQLWGEITNFVASVNQAGGSITHDNIPQDIRRAFSRSQLSSYRFQAPEIIKEFIVITDENRYDSDLAICNLIGGWNEQNTADIEMIRQLVPRGDYTLWMEHIREVLNQRNSPLKLKEGIWSIKDRKVLWDELGTRIFDETLDSFQRAAVTILSEDDPQFELKNEERFAARVYGKIFSYSSVLRKGIAETLAMLGNRKEVLTQCSNNKSTITAILVIRAILENATWIRWGSLDSLLPLLAEAAPTEFLNAVEKALQQSPCPFDELFAQEGSVFGGGNYVSGLLWALEGLAWEEELFVRVCVILGELDTHDPGGNWGNRPANSLEHFFLPWYPQTFASFEKRQAAVRSLRNDFPSVAWKLLLALLPHGHQTSFPTHKPKWRGNVPENWTPQISREEYWRQITFYADTVVQMAKEDATKIPETNKVIDKLPEPALTAFCDHLQSGSVVGLSEEKRFPIWKSLRELVNNHIRFSNAEWAMDSQLVERFESICELLAPKDLIFRFQPLFTDRWFDDYDTKKETYHEAAQRLETKRLEAVREVITHGGFSLIVELARKVEAPFYLGMSLGKIAEKEIENEVLPGFLDNTERYISLFVNGFIRGRQSSESWDWVDKLHKDIWYPAQRATFLSSLPFTEEVWQRVPAWLGNDESLYWTTTDAAPYFAKDNFELAIEKLTHYGRPHAAIQCLDRLLHENRLVNIPQCVRTLRAALSSTEPSYTVDAYRTMDIIEFLQNHPDTNQDDLFNIEWSYLAWFDEPTGHSPKTLENALASEPSFFCEVIRYVYRSKNEEKNTQEITDKDRSFAENAWRLLYKWHTPPGLAQDRTFSGEQCTKWLEEVKKLATESGHLDSALYHVGQVFFYCPSDPEGLWIHHSVAEILNGRDADEMRRGFYIATVNARGVHTVDPMGRPERELAASFRKKADDLEHQGFSRLATTLREVATSYDAEAERVVSRYA